MTVAAVVVAVAVAATIVTVVAPGKKSHPVVGFVPTGTSPEQDGEQLTTAFLTAWGAGNLGLAASYTDSPQAAEAALAAYRDGLHLGTLRGSPTGAIRLPESAPAATVSTPRVKVTVAMNDLVAATASTGTISGTWTYHSSLVAYQKPDSPAWSIAWAPDDLAPNLTATTHLAAVPVAPKATSVLDSTGNSLTSYGDAGLNTIAGALKASPPKDLGQPGLDVEIQSATGAPVTGSQAVISAPVDATLATTISAKAEQAARGAVAEHPQSSLVAIQPSTGQILAIANNAGYNDFALTAAVAPGSTGKIISAAALLSQGVLTANTPVECPAVYTVQGISYHNDKGESEPASTPLSYDFAQSCNNAFSQWWRQESNGRLASVAKEYFGLNQPWDIGLGKPATYYNQPASASGSELAQNMFGQGHLTASPLAMASVAATVANGTFKQPILLPGAAQAAATPLPTNVDAQLKTMMRDVVTQGTAAGLGFGPTVYAKTGTADVDNQGQPNSWFVAFDPARDIAVACLVLNAGYGAQIAAPEVQHFLANY
ncbi:penicillin-binding transpeptidase domain-containing protein [Pseudofrankia inefficax]|uniref:penicillin-binding transpeptidase domain-containing protein n=1 Tax=Pseudofrankia inefficax (strain DSM 45817 / CECT 9037 / DDB 130130 / EuI1c) TaxID=298654 RepID=UPI0003131559|nr:penicillin-binding transpeptidase domain-containing protein [Pseudofrankia inefficax]